MILTTKLYLPALRPQRVPRPRLVERLHEGLAAGRKLTLLSASAGFGKTTLLSEWISLTAEVRRQNDETSKSISRRSARVSNLNFRVAWLSLDEADGDPARFLLYLVSALQTVAPNLGAGALAALQTPQPPPIETLLTVLINEIVELPEKVILVLDDYHLLDSPAVDSALAFLLDHLPPQQLHLVIASREDPALPLARLRARGQLTELRVADLRFSPAEAAEFLNRVMGLNLTEADVAALESRTEGWIAGLQLAALSMQGQSDPASFIQSFTGSHRFVLDYLLEEVLSQQAPDIQDFLLRTSILKRLCGPLCEAVLDAAPGCGQAVLEALEQANLFLVPLDNDRRWYRYHHLFGELLHKRLEQKTLVDEVTQLHLCASQWYEANDMPFEAFHHAAAAHDVSRVERLIDSEKMDLHLTSVASAILDWLGSLPPQVLDVHPRLHVRVATLSLMMGLTSGVEAQLRAVEENLDESASDESVRDLIGQMACARATLALTQYDLTAILFQARRALEYLHPDNLPFRFTANWLQAWVLMFQGERSAASLACQEGLAISEKSGDIFSKNLAAAILGSLKEMENQIHQAAEIYHEIVKLAGPHPQPSTGEVYLGLARIYYAWNELDIAESQANQSLDLMRQYDRLVDRFILSEIFLARLKLARGEVDAAASLLDKAEQTARKKSFLLRLPEVAAVQVLVLLKQGNLFAAADLARQFDLPLSQVRVLLAQGDPTAALAILEPYLQQMEAKAWQDERLKTLVLQAVALNQAGHKDPALAALTEALDLAEPGGFIRLFLDEGEAMRLLMADFRFSIGKTPHRLLGYAEKLLTAFSLSSQSKIGQQKSEILTPRELEILCLVADGLTNEQIASRLYLSLYTVKAHVRNIFAKLNAANRTRAVTRGRELGIIA